LRTAAQRSQPSSIRCVRLYIQDYITMGGIPYSSPCSLCPAAILRSGRFWAPEKRYFRYVCLVRKLMVNDMSCFRMRVYKNDVSRDEIETDQSASHETHLFPTPPVATFL
jgi:hypothetical protein